MITVDLEKELTKKVREQRIEQLSIEQYQRLQKESDLSVLKRVGMSVDVNTAHSKFNQDKVFHIKQIEKIAKKYSLRFLPAAYYKGAIDNELSNKITQFEAAYSERVSHGNTYILAPKSSFKLEERPKDPLFFFKIDFEHYYLIHKWGNDLSITRRLHSISKHPIIYIVLSFFLGARIIYDIRWNTGNPWILLGITLTALSIAGLISCTAMGELTYKNDKWNSRFL